MLRERFQLLSLQGFIFISCLKVCLPQLIDGEESNPWKVEHPKKTSAEIIAELKKHKIIPEIIEQTPSDVSVCEVSYNDSVINFGNIINYTFIQEHEPTHLKWPYKENKLYTLIFTSPDTPGMKEHNERELILWLVGNIPVNNVKNGTSIVDYVGMFPYYEEVLSVSAVAIFTPKNLKISTNWDPW
nr:PREDICTED: OV-16 antigen-like isoform X2 [Bemisia tabaci]